MARPAARRYARVGPLNALFSGVNSMKSLILPLVLFASPAFAQEVIYDFADTTACLDGAQEYAEKLACIGTAAMACMEATDGGWSTAGQNSCLDAELTDWDDRLNAVYPELMAALKAADEEVASYAPDAAVQADALRDMQRAWIPFRDAACAYEASLWAGGTGAGPAATWCLLDETARQVLRLEASIEMTCVGEDCP